MKKIALTLALTLSFIFAYTNLNAASYCKTYYGVQLRMPSGTQCLTFDMKNICYIVWVPGLGSDDTWEPIINDLFHVWMPDDENNITGIGWENVLFLDNPTTDVPESGIQFNTNEQTSEYFIFDDLLNAIQESY